LADILERVITSAILRKAIRAKLHVGASREMISVLVSAYAPSGLRSDRTDGMAPRLAVERIRHRQRIAFLTALAGLPNRRPIARRSLAWWLTQGMRATSQQLHSVEADRRNPS
jgi:hypothetical protein